MSYGPSSKTFASQASARANVAKGAAHGHTGAYWPEECPVGRHPGIGRGRIDRLFAASPGGSSRLVGPCLDQVSGAEFLSGRDPTLENAGQSREAFEGNRGPSSFRFALSRANNSCNPRSNIGAAAARRGAGRPAETHWQFRPGSWGGSD